MRAYGHRSRFEKIVRWLTPARHLTNTSSWTPLADLSGIITPPSLHYERHHAGVPDIDPSRHELLIHGCVKRALVFTLDNIKRFPSISRVCFIECSGNGYREWTGPGGDTVQQTHGLTSCSEWGGVPLRLLLEETGVEDAAS